MNEWMNLTLHKLLAIHSKSESESTRHIFSIHSKASKRRRRRFNWSLKLLHYTVILQSLSYITLVHLIMLQWVGLVMGSSESLWNSSAYVVNRAWYLLAARSAMHRREIVASWILRRCYSWPLQLLLPERHRSCVARNHALSTQQIKRIFKSCVYILFCLDGNCGRILTHNCTAPSVDSWSL